MAASTHLLTILRYPLCGALVEPSTRQPLEQLPVSSIHSLGSEVVSGKLLHEQKHHLDLISVVLIVLPVGRLVA